MNLDFPTTIVTYKDGMTIETTVGNDLLRRNPKDAVLEVALRLARVAGMYGMTVASSTTHHDTGNAFQRDETIFSFKLAPFPGDVHQQGGRSDLRV